MPTCWSSLSAASARVVRIHRRTNRWVRGLALVADARGDAQRTRTYFQNTKHKNTQCETRDTRHGSGRRAASRGTCDARRHSTKLDSPKFNNKMNGAVTEGLAHDAWLAACPSIFWYFLLLLLLAGMDGSRGWRLAVGHECACSIYRRTTTSMMLLFSTTATTSTKVYCRLLTYRKSKPPLVF